MGGAVAPLHPLRVVQNALRFGNAGTFEEHDQVVVAVCGTENLVPTSAVHGDPPATRDRGPVHDDRRAGHSSSLAGSSTRRESDQGLTAARPVRSRTSYRIKAATSPNDPEPEIVIDDTIPEKA
ncbi:hypothetical protein AMK17_32340 [Streptomyces sp. CB00072]|nr:hypothetical protein AMK17_32340 [Streptomyces sp. CB00072]